MIIIRNSLSVMHFSPCGRDAHQQAEEKKDHRDLPKTRDEVFATNAHNLTFKS
jgi:hypothetical protein